MHRNNSFRGLLSVQHVERPLVEQWRDHVTRQQLTTPPFPAHPDTNNSTCKHYAVSCQKDDDISFLKNRIILRYLYVLSLAIITNDILTMNY